MIQKEERLVITFLTTSDAMAMEKACIKENIKGRIIPLPRSLSSHCGLAYASDQENEERIKEVVHMYNIAMEGVYVCLI